VTSGHHCIHCGGTLLAHKKPGTLVFPVVLIKNKSFLIGKTKVPVFLWLLDYN